MVDFAAPPAVAANGNDFDPGYIVSDSEFYDKDAMTQTQIQAFLEQRVPTCRPDRSAGPHDPIVCLKDYRVNTVTIPADSYCKGTYTGASNERASTIIYKVAQACGVSPKALLVTLEKEQGLVSHSWPSSWRYDKAMGFACPDTAPCDTQYFGFQNQVWRAARQFQRYKAHPTNYNYRAGVTNLIGYHPNAACGRGAVTIKNQATAGLYNYTPYQPNSAALNNMYTTGDTCSSYGNRNFWRNWVDWFGSPTVPICTSAAASDITQYWESRGGSTGALGAGKDPSSGVESGLRVGYYANGDVFCMPGSGPVEVTGEIRTLFRSTGGLAGSLGSPASAPATYTASSITGSIQYFTKGLVMSSSVSGTAAVLNGRMRDEWGNRGGAGGSLGWPVNAQENVLSGARQRFRGGYLYVPQTGSALVVGGAYAEYWASGSTMNKVGAPVANSVPWTAKGITGSYQDFVKGMVLSSSETGTHAVLNGAMRNEWGSRGGSTGSLGWPTGEQESISGGIRQAFQFGTLSIVNGVATVGTAEEPEPEPVQGPAAIAAYATTNASRLGPALGDPVEFLGNGVSGYYQEFRNAMVLTSTTTSTYAVMHGPIRDEWGQRLGARGALGWPTGEQESVSGGVRQKFQGGTLSVVNGVASVSGAPAFDAVAAITSYASSNSSKVGAATGSPVAWTANGVSGYYRDFAKAMVLSSQSTGTYAVLNGAIRDEWGRRGGSGGALGWPTGEQESVSGGVRQKFQGGTLTVMNSGSATVS